MAYESFMTMARPIRAAQENSAHRREYYTRRLRLAASERRGAWPGRRTSQGSLRYLQARRRSSEANQFTTVRDAWTLYQRMNNPRHQDGYTIAAGDKNQYEILRRVHSVCDHLPDVDGEALK